MSVPTPPVSLDNSCSVIYNNTLYSYSPQGFQSIRLESGATWKTLDMGVKVTGATCVGSEKPINIDPSFFVVGGQADGDDYPGLQKFTYSTGKWTTVTLSNMVTKHRLNHASTYIEATNTILVFGGSQDGNSQPSTQTFTITASEPYDVQVHNPPAAPNNPPPSIRPILTPWTDSDAAVIGGGTGADNAKVYWFNQDAGWRYSGASLAQPPQKDSSSIQGIIANASDKSKYLIMFDLSQSPNSVTSAILLDSNGSPKLNSPAVARRSVEERGAHSLNERDEQNSGLPQYNSTLAPMATRQNYAIAQADDGMVVFAGGNADSPLAMYDTTNNGWINATSFFSDVNQHVLDVPISTSTTTSATTSATTSSTLTASTNAASTTPAGGPPPLLSESQHSRLSSNAILGITLGSIAGFLALLGLILLCLRLRRKRSANGAKGHPDGASSVEKSMPVFNRNTFSPPGHFRGHRPQASAESFSSVAILMGRVNKDRSGATRKGSDETTRTSFSSLHKHFKSTISKPIPQMMHHPIMQTQEDRGVAFAPSVAEPHPRNGPMEANDGMRRSSGWNRYWSGGSALQILGFGAGKRNTGVSTKSSRYSDVLNNPRTTQDSATVPPLNFEALGRPSVNSVNSGSPVVSQHTSRLPFTEGMSGTIERPISPVSGYSSGIPESVAEAWDPDAAKKPWGTDRAPSSAYAASSVGVPPPPSGVSKQPQLAKASTSDMTWFNLGDQSRA